MKSIYKIFYGVLIISFFSFLFVSCEKDPLKVDDQIENRDSQTSEFRSSSEADSMFRLNLNHLADMFHSANDASNGDLALLLKSLDDTLFSADAFTVIDNSGLINVIQLESAIDHTAYYEGLLLLSYDQEHIESIVIQEVNDLQEMVPQRPFWGVGCGDYIGIVGMPDDKCYHKYVDCRKFRFFIGGAQVENQLIATECPDDD